MDESNHSSSVKVQLTSRDMIDFNFSFIRRNGILWVFLLFGIAMGVNIAVAVQQGKSFSEYQLFVYLLAFIVLFPVLVLVGARRSFENKFMKEMKTYRFSPEGIRMEAESSTANILWQDIRKVVRTKRAVYLFIAQNVAHIIPCRCLDTDEPLRMIEQYASKKSRQRNRMRPIGCIFLMLMIFLVTVGIVQFFLSRG